MGIKNIPNIKPNDDLGQIILDFAEKQGTPVKNADIIVIAQKIVSKAEGAIISLDKVNPSILAKIISKRIGKRSELIEIILRESKSIIRIRDGHIITETKHGWICANSGIDLSNVSGGDSITLLPKSADTSAYNIRKKIEDLTGKKVVVIVSDTFGRPFRKGHIDVAIGISGMSPLFDRRGEKDLYGYVLKIKRTAIADELASAAELVIGNGNEGMPVAIIRGYNFKRNVRSKATDLILPKERNLFI